MTEMTVQKSTTIHVVPEHESAEQIRDEIRSNHSLLAALADKIETMDERETLNYTVCVAIVADLKNACCGTNNKSNSTLK